jgi:hypothetical protein
MELSRKRFLVGAAAVAALPHLGLHNAGKCKQLTLNNCAHTTITRIQRCPMNKVR